MAIADSKDVQSRPALDVGCKDKAILIDFVLIAWLETHSCCERELLYNVAGLADGLKLLGLFAIALLRLRLSLFSLTALDLSLFDFFRAFSQLWYRSFLLLRWLGREIGRNDNLLLFNGIQDRYLGLLLRRLGRGIRRNRLCFRYNLLPQL
jgi:hypothetical protein